MTNDRFNLRYCLRIHGWALSNSAVCGVCRQFSACKYNQPVKPYTETDLYVLTRGMAQKCGTFKNTMNGVEFYLESETDTTPNSEEGNNIPN